MRKLLLHPAVVFSAIFFAILLLHIPVLRLPYFWDEAGYYVPAARDLLLTGSLIPHTTVSNAHPPLVLAWVALWWKLAGYAPLVTRVAMLVAAAFALLGLFRLAERVANFEVAAATTVCTAVYPVFFAQSSLAQVDLAAAGLIFWGLLAYVEDRPVAMAVWFALAARAKETAIIAAVGLAGWEGVRLVASRRPSGAKAPLEGEGFIAALKRCATQKQNPVTQKKKNPAVQNQNPAAQNLETAIQDQNSAGLRQDSATEGLAHRNPGENAGVPPASFLRFLALLFPLLPLIAWYGYHYAKTGYVFGNPEFFRYNVAATLNGWRFLLALALRLWQVFGYQHLWVLTLAMVGAMWLPPLEDDGKARRRIAISVQVVFLVVAANYVFSMALIGGAELARYMLPVIPLVIIVSVATLWRRVPYFLWMVAVVAVVFVAGWFVNPPYGFSPEDNLAYRDFVLLHQDGERFLEARYPMARTLTAWPAADELARPWLGYVTRPVPVVRIEDFSLEEVLSAAEFHSNSGANFDVALVFSTKYQPAHGILDGWKKWEELKTRYFGFHRDLPAAAIARMLGGRIVFAEERKGQWIAVIEMERVEDARGTGSRPQIQAHCLENSLLQ